MFGLVEYGGAYVEGVRDPHSFSLSISSSWVNPLLHTKNQLSKLPESTCTVCVVIVGG